MLGPLWAPLKLIHRSIIVAAHSQADGSVSFSYRHDVAQGQSFRLSSQDSHWMNGYPIFLIMTSILFSDPIHYRLCLVSLTNPHSCWKWYWPLTNSEWIDLQDTGGGGKKTDDSISIITQAQFSLAASLPSRSVFLKNSKHLFAWAGCHI